MNDEKKARHATMYGTGRQPVEAFRFHSFPASTDEAKRLITAYRQLYPAFSLVIRLEEAITASSAWLIVMRRDAWLTLMLQVDDSREPLRDYLGIPILVSDIDEEFIVCGT